MFDAVSAALKKAPGFRLFTILVCEPDKQLVKRIYTSDPVNYPVMGTKPMAQSPWGEAMFVKGEAYIGYTAEDIKEVFFDYELIWKLGCESVINVPIRWGGKTYGTFNLLDKAGHYAPSHERGVRELAQMSLPGVLDAIRDL